MPDLFLDNIRSFFFLIMEPGKVLRQWERLKIELKLLAIELRGSHLQSMPALILESGVEKKNRW